MPRLLLVSNAIAYNLVTLAQAQDKNFPTSPRDLTIQMPATAIEAGNAAPDIVRIGSPNSNTAPTDLSTVDYALQQSGSIRIALERGVPAAQMWLKGSANNNVINVIGS